MKLVTLKMRLSAFPRFLRRSLTVIAVMIEATLLTWCTKSSIVDVFEIIEGLELIVLSILLIKDAFERGSTEIEAERSFTCYDEILLV